MSFGDIYGSTQLIEQIVAELLTQQYAIVVERGVGMTLAPPGARGTVAVASGVGSFTWSAGAIASEHVTVTHTLGRAPAFLGCQIDQTGQQAIIAADRFQPPDSQRLYLYAQWPPAGPATAVALPFTWVAIG